VSGFASSLGKEICHCTASNFICLDVYPVEGERGEWGYNTPRYRIGHDTRLGELHEVCKLIRHCTVMIRTDGPRARRSFTAAEPATPGRRSLKVESAMHV
jgi:hypothetical protein